MDAEQRFKALAKAMLEVVGELWKFGCLQGAVHIRGIAKKPTCSPAARRSIPPSSVKRCAHRAKLSKNIPFLDIFGSRRHIRKLLYLF